MFLDRAPSLLAAEWGRFSPVWHFSQQLPFNSLHSKATADFIANIEYFKSLQSAFKAVKTTMNFWFVKNLGRTMVFGISASSPISNWTHLQCLLFFLLQNSSLALPNQIIRMINQFLGFNFSILRLICWPDPADVSANQTRKSCRYYLWTLLFP